MPLPVKAFQEGQYTVAPSSRSASHAMSFITFTNADGEEQTGWLKRLDETYPEFSANLSVALSVQMRMAVDRVAEDRLCFNREGKLLGTISLSLPNFKPMLGVFESCDDPDEERLRNPSVETLLQCNVAELLVASALSKDNDCHPGNFSLNGLIDHDEREYQWTMIIKGKRWVNTDNLLSWKASSDIPSFNNEDISDFPFLRGRTFTPANPLPTNGNVCKTYKAYQAFQALATNPSIVMNKEKITFQDQLFYALLKEMVSFEPDVLRARLTEYLGDRPFGFLALGKEKSAELARAYPRYFKLPIPARIGVDGQPDIAEQLGNNDEPFVDVMMRFFQDKYDEAYRVIVNYIGCPANIMQKPVISFSQYLQTKPSDFIRIRQRAEEKNGIMAQRWQAHVDRTFQERKADRLLMQPLDVNCLPAACRYDINKMERRYYQIWRDAYSLMFDGMILKAKTLSRSLQKALSLQEPILSTSPTKPTIYDSNYTCSSQLICQPARKEPVALDCDLSNPLGQGLHLINEFIFELQQCGANYYLPCKNLSMEENIANNQVFYQKLQRLFQQYYKPICDKLGLSSWANDFMAIYFELNQFRERLNFVAHQSRMQGNYSEALVDGNHDYSAILALESNHADIIATSLDALFHWAKHIDNKIFCDILLPIIDEYKGLDLFGYRTRGDSIKTYLKQSALKNPVPSCDKLLAYIFSSGGCLETSLNTLLINKLLPIVIGKGPLNLNLKVLALDIELSSRKFNPTLYSSAAQKYVRDNNYFDSPYDEYHINRFNQIFYDFVAKIKSNYFRKQLELVLQDYRRKRPGISYIGTLFGITEGREAEIERYLTQTIDTQSIIALIFSNDTRGYEDNSFNTLLFNRLVSLMERHFSKSPAVTKSAAKAWILDIHLTNNPALRKHYLLAQKQYATDFLAEKRAETNMSSSSSAKSSCTS